MHQRLFSYPIASGQETQLNSLYVAAVTLSDVGGGQFQVNVNVAGANYASAPQSQTDAQALFDLWVQRAEDAR